MDTGLDRQQVFHAIREFHKNQPEVRITPGENYIPPSGKVVGEDELVALVDASLDLWLTAGRFSDEFEKKFAKKMEQKFCLLVNSGSSANLVAFASLTSQVLGDRRIQPGDEVITVAAGFPTTVNPIVQYGCTPVFVDVTLPTYQIDVSYLEQALSEKTKAVVIAHTLGNPFNIEAVKVFCERHQLWLIEDCCDAVGATYNGKSVGTFGDIATVSFYPAHHMTMGEGGAVLTSNPKLKRIAESFRDWGRDCWCPPGVENSCKKRFGWQMGELPDGYDHKYIYSHFGYNLKVTDMQAAVGLAQLSRLDSFVEKRNTNFKLLNDLLSDAQDKLILPEATEHSQPSWFGFPITLREAAKVSRKDLLNHLNLQKIGTRLLFAGNLVKQPMFHGVHKKVIGDLKQTDFVMNNTFWVGVYPGLDESHLKYMSVQIKKGMLN